MRICFQNELVIEGEYASETTMRDEWHWSEFLGLNFILILDVSFLVIFSKLFSWICQTVLSPKLQNASQATD